MSGCALICPYLPDPGLPGALRSRLLLPEQCLLFGLQILMLIVFQLKSENHLHGQEDIPAQQQQEEKNARLQIQNGDQGGAAGTEAPPRQGAQEADRE